MAIRDWFDGGYINMYVTPLLPASVERPALARYLEGQYFDVSRTYAVSFRRAVRSSGCSFISLHFCVRKELLRSWSLSGRANIK